MLRFLSYSKAVAIFLIVFIHVFLAYFNSNGLWAHVVNAPIINNLSYPTLINVINDNFYINIFGFLVAGSVSLFFLASGFTFLISKNNRTFISFWKNRLLRLWPFYLVILIFNFSVSVLSSAVFDLEFHHSYSDFLWQLLLGFQYYIPHGVVLDLVIWFVAVVLMYNIIASILFRKFDFLEVIAFNIVLISLICLSRFLLENNYIFIFTIDNYLFLLKSLVFCFFMSIATVLSIFHYSKKKIWLWVLLLQTCLFLGMYRWNANYINYIALEHYFVWFIFYLFFFLFLFLLNDVIPRIKTLEVLDKISFSWYLSHGYLGYFLLVLFLKWGMGKSFSGLLVLIITALVAYFLYEKVEKNINSFVKKHFS